MSLPAEGLQRRHYINLITGAYDHKWVNPDPTVKMRIGSYGFLDKDTGNFIVQGNVYDPEFQAELDKHGVKIKMSDHPPEVGPTESDVVVFSRRAKEVELKGRIAEVPGIADAPIKGRWVFEKDKTDAVFAMHNPHQIYLPPRVVLEPLYQVDMLMDKVIISVVHVTDAYTYYLSDRSGDTFSLALLPKTPGTNEGFTWWADAPSGLLRQACDPTGECSFMPIYLLLRPIKRIRRRFIEAPRPEPSGDQLWLVEYPPWDPIDEDGTEDVIDPDILGGDPFALVEEQHRQRMAALEAQAALEKKSGPDSDQDSGSNQS